MPSILSINLEDLPGSGTLTAALIETLSREGDLATAKSEFDAFLARASREGGELVAVAMADAYLNARRFEDAQQALDHAPPVVSSQDAIGWLCSRSAPAGWLQRTGTLSPRVKSCCRTSVRQTDRAR